MAQSGHVQREGYVEPISIGRVVHFVMPNGQHLPAIVTDVQEAAVVVQVFGTIDPDPLRLAPFDDGGAPSTWHWPERV